MDSLLLLFSYYSPKERHQGARLFGHHQVCAAAGGDGASGPATGPARVMPARVIATAAGGWRATWSRPRPPLSATGLELEQVEKFGSTIFPLETLGFAGVATDTAIFFTASVLSGLACAARFVPLPSASVSYPKDMYVKVCGACEQASIRVLGYMCIIYIREYIYSL
jgi:hypothetical protein